MDEKNEDLFTYMETFQRVAGEDADKIYLYWYLSLAGIVFGLLITILTQVIFLLIIPIALTGATFYIQTMRPRKSLTLLSKVYWPIAFVNRPDGKRLFFDSLSKISSELFLQFGYPISTWDTLSKRLTNLSSGNIDETLKTLDLCALSLGIDYVRSDKYSVIGMDNKFLKRTFLDSDSFITRVDRNYRPSGLLNSEPIDNYVDEVNFMHQLDEYSKRVLKAAGKYRVALSSTLKSLNDQLYLNIEDLFQEKEEREKKLDYAYKMVSFAYMPVRNLLRRQFEPQKIALESSLNLVNSQIEMSNYLYSEQVRLATKKDDLKVMKKATVSTIKTFNDVNKYKQLITNLNRTSEKVEAKIIELRSRILQVESDISRTQKEYNKLMKKYNNAVRSGDSYSAQSLRSKLNSNQNRLNSLRSRLNSLKIQLNENIEKLKKISVDISTYDKAKNELIRKKQKESKDRMKSIKQRKEAEKETENKSQSKAESIKDTNLKKISNEIETLKNLLASVEIQFSTMHDQFQIVKAYGIDEEFARKIEGFYSILAFANLRGMMVSSLLKYSDERILSVTNKRHSYYLDFKFPNENDKRYSQSGYFCLPIWVTEITDRTDGSVRRRYHLGFTVKQSKLSGWRKILGLNSGIVFQNLQTFHPDVINSFSKNYDELEQIVQENNLLDNSARYEEVLNNVEELVTSNILGKKTKRWVQFFSKKEVNK